MSLTGVIAQCCVCAIAVLNSIPNDTLSQRSGVLAMQIQPERIVNTRVALQCALRSRIQITHIVTTFGGLSGRNRTEDGRPFCELVKSIVKQKGISHFIWAVSNPRLGRADDVFARVLPHVPFM